MDTDTATTGPRGWIQFGECDHPTMYSQRRDAPKTSAVAWELYSKAYDMMMKVYPQAYVAIHFFDILRLLSC